MSVITVQLGQCGNQIGGQFFSSIIDDAFKPAPKTVPAPVAKDYSDLCMDRFFSLGKNEKWTARAVMVDTEQKAVVQTVLNAEKSGRWCYPAVQPLLQKKGSGNNWALGFCGYGPTIEERVMESVRSQAEQCDRLGGFLMLMSLAGGTGSGVGAYVTQCIREEFAHSFIVNQVVCPYVSGEVAVQSYNAVLSLAHVYNSADAVVMLENDTLQKICTRLFSIPKVSIKDINRVIVHQMSSVLTPAFSSTQAASSSRAASIVQNPLGDLLEHLVPHAEYKLLSLRSIPLISDRSVRFTTYQWPGLLKHLRQMLIANASMEEGINWQVKSHDESINRSLANLLVLRGLDAECAETEAFSEPSLYTRWQNPEQACSVWYHPRPFLQYERSATLLSNDAGAVRSLNSTVDRAWQMYAARAYMHQYTKHGLEEATFMDSFATLEQVLANYNRL